MSRYFLITVFLLPGLACAADVSVSGAVNVREGNTSISVVYSNRDRATIDEYYRRHRDTEYAYRRDRDDDDDRYDDREKRGKRHGKGMPPGLAKRGGDLPPRSRMPAGAERPGGSPRSPPGRIPRRRALARQQHGYEPLPRELERQLPPLPSTDYVRVRVGTDFLILNRKTHVVFDIVKDLGG